VRSESGEIPISLISYIYVTQIGTFYFTNLLISFSDYSLEVIRRFLFNFSEIDFSYEAVLLITKDHLSCTFLFHRTHKSSWIFFIREIEINSLTIFELNISFSFIENWNRVHPGFSIIIIISTIFKWTILTYTIDIRNRGVMTNLFTIYISTIIEFTMKSFS